MRHGLIALGALAAGLLTAAVPSGTARPKSPTASLRWLRKAALLAATLIIALPVSAAGAGALFGSSAPKAPSTLTPVADSYVDSSAPTLNEGTSTQLRVDGSPVVHSYLKFDLSGLSGTVTSAVLHVYANSAQSKGYDVYPVADTSWSETGIDWNNAPPFGSAKIGSSGSVKANTWTSVDVTSAVTTGGILSFGLSTTSRRTLSLSSREGANPPQLVVTTGGGGGGHPNISFPARGAFYYPWYPETWTVGGDYPHYTPSLGYYNSSTQSIVDQHIQWLDAAKVEVGIASWWGQGTHSEAIRIPLLLNRTQALSSPLKWTIYYEPEGAGNPTVAQIQSDLAYLKTNYASSPSWAYANGKPVIFVYGDANDGCSMVDRWHQAAPDWYVVLKVFAGYKNCANQPDSWHQYSPDVREDHQAGYSFSISPGFWKADEANPRLSRDPAAFQQAVSDMVASGEPWQLVTTFNEWGEGTGFENAVEYGSTYLDILAGGSPPPPVTHTLSVSKTGSGSGTVTSSPSGINCGSTCSASFNDGTSVTLTETPASGSTFAGWSGDCSGTSSTCTLTMSADHSAVANFSPNPVVTHILSVSKTGTGSGTVTSSPSGINCGSTCSASFNDGTSVTLTETPASGSTFGGWSGDCSGTSSTCTVAMSADRSVTAQFDPVSTTGPCGSKVGQTSTITKVMWILMENHDYSSIIGSSNAPYENQIANQCGLASNYHGISHPSLPNYIALTSGGTQGITDDSGPSAHPLDVNSIYHQAYPSAKGYAESMPANCNLSDSGSYAVRHAPWAYYVNGTVGNQRTECQANDVPLGTTASGALHNDVVNGALPKFSFVTPNLCNDMHDCSVATGDAWLANFVPFVLSGSDYTSGHLAVVITFDENGGSSGNQVYTAVISPFTAPGTVSSTNYTHYSLLRTTEEILGVPLLGSAASANSMRSAYGL